MAPVFVGGTGRSGTTITGRLIDAHPSRQWILTETRFIVDPGGLCDLVAGRSTFAQFEKRLLGYWFERGPRRGLFKVMDRDTLRAALPALRAGLKVEPYLAARIFAHRVLDPIAAASGATGWIEMTPSNAIRGDALMRIFPDMRLVHTVRDGRDVACSVVRLWWGPNDVDEALDWWATKLERAFAACDLLPNDRVLVVQLEDLVTRDRERQFRRLRDFLGLEDAPSMRTFFDETMNPTGGHFGRWRQEVPPERLAAFEEHHRVLAGRLAARGRPYVAQEALAARAS